MQNSVWLVQPPLSAITHTTVKHLPSRMPMAAGKVVFKQLFWLKRNQTPSLIETIVLLPNPSEIRLEQPTAAQLEPRLARIWPSQSASKAWLQRFHTTLIKRFQIKVTVKSLQDVGTKLL